MASRQPLVVGNWKLHGSRASANQLASDIADGIATMSIDVAVCPTFVHLADVRAVLDSTQLRLGAQNCAEFAEGAFTGEVSATMLADIGCEFVIVGHSERRQLFAETSAQIAVKVRRVQDASMLPVLCVGETLEERENNAIQKVIDEQIDAVVAVCGIEAFSNLVVAYEPVWAIGTGKTATPEQAQDVHAMIRAKLAAVDAGLADQLRILYGGSVKPDNAAMLFSKPDIDGGLIGGAALDAGSFLGICLAANKPA